jgi:hypothetical protein
VPAGQKEQGVLLPVSEEKVPAEQDVQIAAPVVEE